MRSSIAGGLDRPALGLHGIAHASNTAVLRIALVSVAAIGCTGSPRRRPAVPSSAITRTREGTDAAARVTFFAAVRNTPGSHQRAQNLGIARTGLILATRT